MTGRVILAMDTVLASCSVAIARDGQVLASDRHLGRRGHAERLPGMIEAVLAEAGLGQQDLTHYAVTKGPGSFAGIRVALAATRAMALVTGHPIIGLSSLQVVAAAIDSMSRQYMASRLGHMAVLFDARRDQVYYQEFLPDDLCTPVTDPALLPIDAVQAILQGRDMVLAGSGVPVVLAGMPEQSNLISAPDLCDSETSPDALALLRLASTAHASHGPVEPLYIRPPDAKLPGGIDPA